MHTIACVYVWEDTWFFVFCRFSFSDPDLPVSQSHPPITLSAKQPGLCHGIAMWWCLGLMPGVELSLSPWSSNWQVGTIQAIIYLSFTSFEMRCVSPFQWRDHWLQCVHFLPQPAHLEPGRMGGIGTFSCTSTNDVFKISSLLCIITINKTIRCFKEEAWMCKYIMTNTQCGFQPTYPSKYCCCIC